jgi:hypothetical protein
MTYPACSDKLPETHKRGPSMLLSRYRILLASSAFLAVASFAAPSMAADPTPAAEAPAPAAQQVAAEVPVSAPAKAAANETAPARAAPAVRAKPVRAVAVKPRAIVAVSRPRAVPYRAYRIARYPVPHSYGYNGGGGHMIMLGVAY